MVNKVYCITMKLLAALFLLNAVDCKSFVNQKKRLQQNADQNHRKRINTKDAKSLDIFSSPFKNQANKRLTSDYFNMAEIMDRMWDEDDYSDNNRESLLRTPIYHAYDEEKENIYRDDIRRDRLISNEHKRKYRHTNKEDLDLIDLTRQGSDSARLSADHHNIVAKPTESDCKKILNKILLILLQYLNKPDEPLSKDEILRKILLMHLGSNKLSLEHSDSKVNFDTVDLTRGGSNNYDPSAESTSDKNNTAETVLKIKQLLQSKITVNVGDIVDVIVKHTRPVLIKTGRKLCKNLAMEYLISSVNEAYDHLLNNTVCSDAFNKINNVTFDKSKELANVIESLQSDELTKLILSTNLPNYIKGKVRNMIDESNRISKKNGTHGLQDKFSNLADRRAVRSRERSKKRSSDKFLRQVLFNTVHSKITEERCHKIAIDTFLKKVRLIILRAKNMKCNSFAKKIKSPWILRSKVKELFFNNQNYVTEDDYDMGDSVEEVGQANPRVKLIKDLLLNPKILDSQEMGKKSNEFNNVLKLTNNDSIKYSDLLKPSKGHKLSPRRPSFNMLKKYFSYFEQESGLNTNTSGMHNKNTDKKENVVPNLQQSPNSNFRVKHNEIKKESLDSTNHVTEIMSGNLILSYVDDIRHELAGNAANIHEPRDFQDSERNEKYEILEKVKPTASNMGKRKLFKYQPNSHKLKFSKRHYHTIIQVFGSSSQGRNNKIKLLPNDLPDSHEEIKSKITILPERAEINMKNLSIETDKTFQNVSTTSYSPLITFNHSLNENHDENGFIMNHKDDIPIKSSNDYRKLKRDENNIAEYLNEYLESTRGRKSDGDDLSNVEPSLLRITEVPKSIQLQLNNLPLPDGIQQYLNIMKNLSQSSQHINLSSAENAVELTYIVRHPEVIMFHPLTKIKFHLPYKYYTENKKEIVNEVQNKEQFGLIKVVKLLSKGDEVLYETKVPEPDVLIFNRGTLNLKPANVETEINVHNTNDSLQRDENHEAKKETGEEISETLVIKDKLSNTTEGGLIDLINVLAKTDISELLDKNESYTDSPFDNADNNRNKQHANNFRVDSTEFSNFQSQHGATVDGPNDKLHMNIDGKIVWNNYPSKKKYTQRKTLIYPYNSRAYKNTVKSHNE